MSTDTNFVLYTSVLFGLPLGLVVLIILQILVDRHHRHSTDSKRSERDSRTTALLYAVYGSGFLCGVVGFSLHFVNNVLWCEKFGLIPCFALLGLSKSFLYLFFLRRAKLAQGIVIHKYMRWLFNYIAPAYLFVYWMIYCVLTTIVFTGQFSHDAISNCNILGDWAAGFSTFAGFVELFNSLASVTLFSYPLIRAMHQVKLLNGSHIMDDADRVVRLQFISVMKWNVSLTAIASLSSVTNLFMLLVAGHYIWLFCLGDPFINGLCTFLMIAPNREFMAKYCCTKPGADWEPSQENKPHVHTVRSNSSCKSKTESAMTANCDETLPQSEGVENEIKVTVQNI